jgi:hypothetical protein
MTNDGNIISEPRLHKGSLAFGPLKDERNDLSYWLSVDPRKRLEAIEINRQAAFGRDVSSTRLQRVLDTAELRGR